MVPSEERAPRTVDSAERAQLIKAVVLFAGPCFIILGALWFFLAQKGVISSGLALALVLLDAPVAVAAAIALNQAIGHGSRSFVATLYAWGSAPQGPPTYPRQEMLIVRGQYAEAAEYFRDHIRVNPADLNARLQLARLLEKHLKGDVEAEQLYGEVRRLAKERHHAVLAANGLIDLYRRTGRVGRLRMELALFADRFKGTQAARSAARELKELKEDLTT